MLTEEYYKRMTELDMSSQPQYDTGMHYPYCSLHNCTGCLPPIRIIPEPEKKLDLSIFRKD